MEEHLKERVNIKSQSADKKLFISKYREISPLPQTAGPNHFMGAINKGTIKQQCVDDTKLLLIVLFCYLLYPSDTFFTKFGYTDRFENYIKNNQRKIIIVGYFNTKSLEWDETREDNRDRILSEWTTRKSGRRNIKRQKTN